MSSSHKAENNGMNKKIEKHIFFIVKLQPLLSVYDELKIYRLISVNICVSM